MARTGDGGPHGGDRESPALLLMEARATLEFKYPLSSARRQQFLRAPLSSLFSSSSFKLCLCPTQPSVLAYPRIKSLCVCKGPQTGLNRKVAFIMSPDESKAVEAGAAPSPYENARRLSHAENVDINDNLDAR